MVSVKVVAPVDATAGAVVAASWNYWQLLT